jgi:rare lipoprotein A
MIARASIVSLLLACAALAAPLQQQGKASWYGEEYRGKRMANGRPFNPDALTCASWFHPLGTVLEVKHRRRSVFVIVTDRGPRADIVARGVVIDLSRRAFELLDNPDRGLVAVTIQRNLQQ